MVVAMHVPVILVDLWSADRIKTDRGCSMESPLGVLAAQNLKHLVSMPVCPNLLHGFEK